MDKSKIFAAPRFPTANLADFESFCRMLSKLKAHGRVMVDIGSRPDLLQHEMPRIRSPWHDYTSRIPTLFNFFPHPKIAPHLSAGMVEKNRSMLISKAAILRKLGLEACFHGQDPHFLPESFFRQHPHLRGPRIDHPRRSRQEEFSLCVDLDETLEMYEWMMAEFKRTVPELAMYEFNTNDAGGGFCWAAALYSGPNGPRHCRHRSAGQRVRSFLDALNRGAEKGGGKIDIRIDHANFWQNEREVVRPLLPPNAILASPDPSVIRASTAIGDGYPILGLFNPASTLESLERANDEAVRWVDVSVGVPYTRAHEKLNVIERLLEIVDDAVREPARGMLPRIQKLRRFCARWAGEKHADDLSEAFLMFQDCLRTASMLAPHFTPIYSGLSMRLLTRPLVIKPELLAPQEEAYFLPFIFNPDEQEARCDYNDWHGGRVQVNVMAEANSFPAFQQVLARAQSAARKIEAASAAPDAAWLRQISQSVRIWASTMRSCHNFYFAQLIRDRNRQALAYPATFPSKTESWSGHPDILPWNELMRDEFDNTLELIALLEDGGLEMVSRAENPAGEDPFVLGPDLIGALKKKASIMREHWLDIEKYLAPPHK